MKSFSWLEWTIIAAIVVVLVSAAASLKAKSEHKTAFMGECLSERKQYECDVLWGQANNGGDAQMATGLATGLAIGIASGRR